MFFHTIFHIVFFSFLPMWINNVCFISSHHTILVFIIWFLYLESWDDFHANKHNFYCIIFNGYFLKTLQNSLYLMLDINQFMGFLSYRQNSFYCVWLHCASKILFLLKKKNEGLSQLCVNKSIGTIFPTAFTHLKFLCHSLVTLSIFQTLHW